MPSERVIVVAVEDIATAGVVAVGAAHLAMEQGADRLILVHVLDDHVVTNGLAGLVGGAPPLVETAAEGRSILRLAKQTVEAECRAANHSLPACDEELGEGRPGPTIARVATDNQAAAIVIGARRPHALGRLAHPEVVEHLRRHTAIPVHVVALQAETSPSS